MLISRTLVELVERDARALAGRRLADVRRNPNTPFYHDFREETLFDPPPTCTEAPAVS